MKDAKDRILEFIAVGKLRGAVQGKVCIPVGHNVASLRPTLWDDVTCTCTHQHTHTHTRAHARTHTHQHTHTHTHTLTPHTFSIRFCCWWGPLVWVRHRSASRLRERSTASTFDSALEACMTLLRSRATVERTCSALLATAGPLLITTGTLFITAGHCDKGTLTAGHC
jgi:hypothetical protein